MSGTWYGCREPVVIMYGVGEPFEKPFPGTDWYPVPSPVNPPIVTPNTVVFPSIDVGKPDTAASSASRILAELARLPEAERAKVLAAIKAVYP